ncbi:MAG: GIY-YIG nuclease family protein, partial [Planctomycetota bacterium]|nr:GIY-YIG nuclease family protein [Planctomycetota bacterium]
MSRTNLQDKLLRKARALPAAPGVYIMKDAEGSEIYVGKAKDLRRRVASYFQVRQRLPKEQALIANIADFSHVECESEIEAFLLENRLIKDLKPKYNLLLKNTDVYPLIEISWEEDFPRVEVVYKKTDPRRRYFGPFVASGDLRGRLALLQRIFRFRTCRRQISAADERRRFQRGCLNYHVGRCAGACCAAVSRADYRRRIASLCRFLSGQKKDLLAELRADMAKAAAALQFETAATLRDLIASLEEINRYPAPDENLAPLAPAFDTVQALTALADALRLAKPAQRIEGLDIAHLQGKESVGAVVTFIGGAPFKEGYRRFRIKTAPGQDDCACLAEVARRRYSRLLAEGGEMPEIVLVDGGPGQLSAVAAMIEEVGAAIPAILALAKGEEILRRHGVAEALPLTKRHPGLKLLMYV